MMGMHIKEDDMQEDNRDQERSDERYARALRAFQSGDWAEAIQNLEDLNRENPSDKRVQDLLEEARFKSRLGSDADVKARTLLIPWRRIIIGILAVAIVGAGLWFGYRYISEKIVPAMAQAYTEEELQSQLDEAKSYFDAGDWDRAETLFNDYLVLDPDNEQAREALESIARNREIESLYVEGVRLHENGDFVAALSILDDLAKRSPGYKDVESRLTSIRHGVALSDLLAQAEEAFSAGDVSTAVSLYEQVRMTDTRYEEAIVEERLFGLYSQLGLAIVNLEPVVVSDIPLALDYFSSALAIRPRDAAIVREKNLGTSFLTGWSYYESGDWNNAYRQLEAVQQQDPGYGGSVLRRALYESYVSAGDMAEAQGDIYLAYELYRRGTLIMGVDVSYAMARMTQLKPFITPSPTPTATPIPSATPVPVPPGYVPAPTRMATPKPIESYRGQIVFEGTSEGKTGYWVVQPDGSQLQYLGAWRSVAVDIEEQKRVAAISPNGDHQLFVRDISGIAQVFKTQPVHDQYGELPPFQITRLGGLCYDPVWSPDGSRIAFVSQETGSDDIWVIYPDGTGGVNLTENSWPWDKHPSWSPDSRRITFWSNRSGTSQIYVMDADGSNVVMLTEFEDATDPVWIK